MSDIKLDEFTQSYVYTAMEFVEQPNASDKRRYGIEDIDPTAMDRMIKDCAEFQTTFGELLGGKAGVAGRCFYLTRNRERCGFGDSGYWTYPVEFDPGGVLARIAGHSGTKDAGNFLTAMVHSYGHFGLIVYRGTIHGYP